MSSEQLAATQANTVANFLETLALLTDVDCDFIDGVGAHEDGFDLRRSAAFALEEFRALTAPTRDGEMRRLRKWLKHDGLCGIVGGYGYCTCGLDEALATQAEDGHGTGG